MVAQRRALGLFSGGLDSMLAAAVLRDQGLEVTGITFITPFFGAERARESAAHMGLPLLEEDLTELYLPLLLDPPHGFGSRHNPCIDCHLLMLRQAGRRVQGGDFDFLFTGEVLGQRPMSQHRGALNLIARESGLGDLILRPLSAKLLKPTLPEREGWVDRERLLDLSGRGRKRQMALAPKFGISSYPSPAGGCLLTDPGYAHRLKELLAHTPRPPRRELELLKWGRHFRLPHGSKAVVGRTHRENEALKLLVEPGDLVMKVKGIPGPLVVLSEGAGQNDLAAAGGLTASYSDAVPGMEVEVIVQRQGGGETVLLQATAADKEEFKDWLI